MAANSTPAVTVKYDALLGGAGDYHGRVLRLLLSFGDRQRAADIRIHHNLIMLDKIPREDLVPIMLLLGLPRLRAVIEAEGVDAFFADPEHRWIELNTETVPADARAAVDRRKECHFQEQTKRGLTCEVSESRLATVRLYPENATTQAVCDACGHPDDKMRCSALMHVWTEANLLGPSGYRRDARGTCNAGYLVLPQTVGQSPEESAKAIQRCKLGERECARLEWRFEAPGIDVSGDVGRRLAHELDYLDLVANDRFGFHPRTLTDAESVAMIVRDDVASRADFTSALAALVGLINAMRWPVTPSINGSLNALEAFATAKAVVLEPSAIRALRAIVTLRQAPPIHNAATEAARAAAQLGLPYPITDPVAAWRTVRGIAAGALRSIGDSLRRSGDSGST